MKVRIQPYEQVNGTTPLGRLNWVKKWDVCVQCDSEEEANHVEFVMKNLWPFPPFPNPKDKGTKRPKFNPDNYEDAPL